MRDEQCSSPPSPPHVGSISRCSAAASGAPHLLSDFPSAAFSPPASSVRLAGILRQGVCDARGMAFAGPFHACHVTLSGRSSAAETLQSPLLLHPRCVLSLRRLFRLQCAVLFVRSSRCSDAGGRRRSHQSRRLWSSASQVRSPASQTAACIQPATSRFPPRVPPRCTLFCAKHACADASPVLVEHVGETNALLHTTKGPSPAPAWPRAAA